MGMNASTGGRRTCADVIPVFPLAGRAAAAARADAAQHLRAALPRHGRRGAASANRIIGMIQPDPEGGGTALVPKLYQVGCAGRITQFAETGDGRYLITLSGIARFRVEEELADDAPYPPLPGQFRAFRGRFRRPGRRGRGRPGGGPHGPAGLRRGRPICKLDWKGVEQAPNEALVNALSHDEPVRRAREAGAARGAGPQDPRRDAGRDHRDRARPRPRRRRLGADPAVAAG